MGLILAYIGLTLGILIASYYGAALIRDWVKRRSQREESRSLTDMLAGDRRTADVVQLRPRAD